MNRIFAIFAITALTLAAAPAPLVGFVPDPEGAGGTGPADNGAWTFSSGGIAARLTPLDDISRMAWLKREAGTDVDPFAGKPGEPSGFITFLLIVANGSETTVMFEPQRIWLQTNKNEVKLPLDIHTMQSAYRLKSGEMPAAYEHAAARLLAPVSLEPGQRTVGLLVYKAINTKTRSFVVEILLTDHTGEEVSFMAAYKREKKKRKK